MNVGKQDVLARGSLALRAVLLAACGIGLFFSGCTPPQRTVDFTASSVDGLAPLAVVFTAVADADAQSFTWDFGDGGTSTDPVALHVYRTGGVFTVTLTVVFADGATGSATKSDLIQVASPDVQPGMLYWITSGGAFMRGARDGSFQERIGLGSLSAHTLEIYNGKLYWTDDTSSGRIVRANLDGSERETLVDGIYRPRGLTIDGRHAKIYWTTFPTPPNATESETAWVMSSDLEGRYVIELRDSLSSDLIRCADAIAVDPMANRLLWALQLNAVYFPDNSGEECRNELRSARLDASSPVTLRGNLCHMADLVLDLVANAPALHMYWIMSQAYPAMTDVLVRANPNGETEKVLVTGIDGGTSLDIDVAAGALYWADSAGIHRANLDGTSPVLIFPGVIARSIALDD